MKKVGLNWKRKEKETINCLLFPRIIKDALIFMLLMVPHTYPQGGTLCNSQGQNAKPKIQVNHMG